MLRRVAGPLLLLIQVLAVGAFWLRQQLDQPLGNPFAVWGPTQWLAWGRLAGLYAALACLVQVVLVGRVRWVEQVFGLDRLARWHHATGFALVALLLAHPLFVTAGHAAQAGVSWAAQSLDFLRNWEDAAAAYAGLAVLLAAVAVSVGPIRRRLRYEAWHAVHLGIYVALALAFGHQLAIGSDLTASRAFRVYWLALYVFAFGNLLVYRVARPLRNFARHRFAVSHLERETPDVCSVYLEGRSLERFRAAAGQFAIVRFLAPGFRWEAHPFSLSQRPDGRGLRLTIKALGDFTRRIPALPPGTAAILDGPHGVFTARRCRADKVLLLAGGIGITPIRALIEDLVAEGRDAVLLYGNRDRNTTVFAAELDRLAAASGGRLRVVHVLSADPSWDGEKGYLDGPCISRLAPDFRERDVFLCGPPPMMRLVRAALLAAGVPHSRIFDERFVL
jgi:predicted ferric reductase